jgi:hypothetical protein
MVVEIRTLVAALPAKKNTANSAKNTLHGCMAWITATTIAVSIPTGVKDLCDQARYTSAAMAGTAMYGFIIIVLWCNTERDTGTCGELACYCVTASASAVTGQPYLGRNMHKNSPAILVSLLCFCFFYIFQSTLTYKGCIAVTTDLRAYIAYSKPFVN